MENVLRDAQSRFQEIHNLLNINGLRDASYFTQLSIATEEAYVLMNEGMCANTSVCSECAAHRDFIRSLLDVLSILETDSTSADTHAKTLAQYSERVAKILKNIGAVLAS